MTSRRDLPEYTISQRARGVWKRFAQWYGGDTVTRNFGQLPPQEWCEAIDSIRTRQQLEAVLAEVRARHVTFPPRLPEFEAIVAQFTPAASSGDGPSRQDRLVAYVLRQYGSRLTPLQVRSPWAFIGRRFDAPDATGKIRPNHGVEITGVIVPADPERQAPSYRVMFEDLQLEVAA